MILNQVVNIFPSAASPVGSLAYHGSKVKLRDVLIGQHGRYSEVIHKLRTETNEDVQKAIKRQELPCYFVSCYCEADGNGSRSLNAMLYHTGLIALDLDGIGNNIHEIKKELISWPQVAYCSLSCRGNGLFAIFRIDDPTRHAEYYEKVFLEVCNELGIASNFDSSVKNINRLRLVTLDLEYYINDYPKSIKLKMPKIFSFNNQLSLNPRFTNSDLESKLTLWIQYLYDNKIDLTSNYCEWINIGFSLADLGERGRNYFHQISMISSKYNLIKTDKKFDQLLRTYNKKVTVGSLIYLLKKTCK